MILRPVRLTIVASIAAVVTREAVEDQVLGALSAAERETLRRLLAKAPDG